MKKLFPALILPLLLIFLPSLLTRLFAGTAGMAICFILFLAVNPVYFALLGIFCSRSVKTRWYLPPVSALIYVLTMCVVFTFTETAWYYYAAIYLFISLAVGAASAIIRKIKTKETDT